MATDFLNKYFGSLIRVFLKILFVVVRDGATISRVGVQILLRAKRAENFWGLYPHICHSGGTTATKRGIRRTYRTTLIQYLTVRARAILANI